MHFSWEKTLSPSEALRPRRGSLMPFLRLTKSQMPHDHRTWFRHSFFSDLDWDRSEAGKESAPVAMHVVILGEDCGHRTMMADHRPARAGNHSAPTTHLHYDSATRTRLLLQDLTRHPIRLVRDGDSYFFEIL